LLDVNPSSARPDFWEPRYLSGRTPWDLGFVPASLTRFLDARPGHGARVLIPGCGSGYEVAAFAAAGYHVTAIDFSPAAITRARQRLGPALAERVVLGDFFSYDFPDAPFDLVYERTFLCALPPELWPKLVARTHSLLGAGGTLVGLYYFGEKDDGPPYGLEETEAATLFAQHFALVANHAVPTGDSPPMFAGRERWQERRRLR
jgi:SAM-dependent methyltransferase